MTSQPDGPLQTVRVLDYSRSAAAGRAARQLADLGARVIRTTDPTSTPNALTIGAERLFINWNTVEGQQLALRFTERADIVLFDTDDPPSPMINADKLLDRSPRVVAASMSRFGASGPASEPGGVSDALEQAVKQSWTVRLAGTLLAQAALAAVLHRRAAGEGQWVHTSLLEVALHADTNLRRRLSEEPQVMHLALEAPQSTEETLVVRHPVTATETPTFVRPTAQHPDEVARDLCAELGFTDNSVAALTKSGALLAEESDEKS